MVDDVLRMRTTIVDEGIPILRALQAQMGLLGKNVNTSTARKEVSTLKESFEHLRKEVKEAVEPVLGSLGIQSGGVVVALTGMAYATKRFVDNLSDLKTSSSVLGLSIQELRAFSLAADKAGVAPEVVMGGIAVFRKNAEDFALRIGELRNTLMSLGAGDVVEAIARAKTPLDGIRLAFERMEYLQRTNPAVARRFAEAMFGSAKFAELGWVDFLKAMHQVEGVSDDQLRKSEAFRKAWIDMGVVLDQLKEKAQFQMLPTMSSTIKDIGLILDGLKWIDHWIEEHTGVKEGQDLLGVGASKLLGRSSRSTDPMGDDYTRGMKAGPQSIEELRRSFAKPPVANDYRLPGFREKDPARKEDTKEGIFEGLMKYFGLASANAGGSGGGMQNAAFTTGGGLGGGGSGGGGAPRFGSNEYPNQTPSSSNPAMAGQGGGPGPMPGGGAPGGGGGTGGTRGDRNFNPGNLKMGPLAQQFGATKADDRGFAVFPDRQSGSEAQEALIKSDRYKGLTLDQFGKKYAEGDASWKKTVGGALGIGPNDKVDNQDPRLSGAIRKAEGTMGGGDINPRAMDPMARAGAGLSRDTTQITSPSGRKFTVAAEFKENFQKFINSYEEAGGKIGPSSGGLSGRPGNASYHPLGRAIDVNQIGRGVRSRDGGGLTREQEDQLAEQAGLYPGSKFGDAGHFEVRNRELAMAKQRAWSAERIDQQNVANGKMTAEGTVNLNVHAPPGTKVKADSDGLWQQTTIRNYRQMQSADQGPPEDLTK
jgi:hypothetical protein